MIYNLYKKRGETPLECIERFKSAKIEKFGDYYNNKMTYLGRLDPLAEGVLLVGSGEDTTQKNREKFFNLDKEYEFSALFGFKTDTFDVMGKIISDLTHPLTPSLILRDGESGTEMATFQMDLIKICKIYEGEREQKYPKYSSKIISKTSPRPDVYRDDPLLETGEGKDFALPLQPGEGRHTEGVRDEVKMIIIHKLRFHKLEKINNKELFGKILMDISRVNGDFRQHEILALWKQALFGSGSPSLVVRGGLGSVIGHFSAHVSSGTYIRSLVNDMGNTLGCGATTLSIKRTRVGDFKIEESLRFF